MDCNTHAPQSTGRSRNPFLNVVASMRIPIIVDMNLSTEWVVELG